MGNSMFTPHRLRLPAALLACATLPIFAQQPQPDVVTSARASEQRATSLEQLTADHDWLRLERRLASDNAGPEHDFYSGLLENRERRYRESLAHLEPLLPALAAEPTRLREKQARLTVADNYLKLFDYRHAATAYAALDACCTAVMNAEERDAVEIPAHVLPLLAAAPAPSIELTGSFSEPVERNRLGLIDVSVWVDGYPARWLLDPAANFTMLARSQASLVGLRLSEAPVKVQALDGRLITVHAAVVPRIRFGRAVFHNIPAMVYEDTDLRENGYQIEGVLAQPMLAQLGQITVFADERLGVNGTGAPMREGAPLFTDGERLLAAAGAPGAEQVYALDPGTRGSELGSRYYDAYLPRFAQQSPQQQKISAEESVPSYRADTVEFEFGGETVEAHDLLVLAAPAGPEHDRYFGVLRQDVLEQWQSYTLDFRSMRFLPMPYRGQ